MNLFSSKLYQAMEWISRFVYLQILWLLFTLAGLILFGFYPSTTAMFSVMRKWLQGNSDLRILPAFWSYYKSEFAKSNLLGIILTAIVALLIIDLQALRALGSEKLHVASIPLFAFILLFLLYMCYLLPAFAHYQLSLPSLLKNTFLVMLISPLHSLLMTISLVPLFFILKAVPAIALLSGGSLYAFFTMWLSMHAFERIREKQQKNISP